MSAPVVSVVLPMKDAEGTISEAIESVLAERDVVLELVCVDDGSTDGTAGFVRERSKSDPRLRVVESRGVGIVAALQTGVACSNAPYIGRMDADDVSVPGRFAASVAYLDSHPDVGAVGTRVCVLREDESDPALGVERHVAWLNGVLTPEDHARERFIDSPLCHPSTTLRRSAYVHVGGYRECPYAEDYDLWLRMLAHGHALAKLEATMLAWRHRRARLTFTDPRCTHEQFRACKAEHLTTLLETEPRKRLVWGAGRDGHRLARALVRAGARIDGFIDIDPMKIGKTRLGLPIVADTDLPSRSEVFVIVCVGTQGARGIIREKLTARGFLEQIDFFCAA